MSVSSSIKKYKSCFDEDTFFCIVDYMEKHIDILLTDDQKIEDYTGREKYPTKNITFCSISYDAVSKRNHFNLLAEIIPSENNNGYYTLFVEHMFYNEDDKSYNKSNHKEITFENGKIIRSIEQFDIVKKNKKWLKKVIIDNTTYWLGYYQNTDIHFFKKFKNSVHRDAISSNYIGLKVVNDLVEFESDDEYITYFLLKYC